MLFLVKSKMKLEEIDDVCQLINFSREIVGSLKKE
jgi:hypothetical protein